MIYAKAILGPAEQPNRKTIVRIITQIPGLPADRYLCREIGTDQTLTIFKQHLELFWMEDLNQPHES